MKKNHIIVAEDENHTRHTMRLILKKAGYRVTTVEDGHEALQKILDNIEAFEEFDLLITDVQMPELSGVELIRELAKQNIDIPILIITGYGDRKEYADAVGAMCVGCIEKPFEPKDLLECVDRVLEKHGRLQVIKQAI